MVDLAAESCDEPIVARFTKSLGQFLVFTYVGIKVNRKSSKNCVSKIDFRTDNNRDEFT